MRDRHQFAPAAIFLALTLLIPTAVAAQHGGSETGDLFGDLIHIKRDPTTGQPILQKREILLPEDVLGIGYCPIPVDAAGQEIPFVDQSCDPDPAYLDQIVEVDYFGRLSGGRTKERNQRMHFDEMIDNLKAAEAVGLDEAGRLRFGTSCDAAGVCATWKTVDSPMENLAIYRRVMKYGHLQTDPLEIDTWAHGDPEAGTQYHPALGPEDWPKFRGAVRALLPRADASQCFSGETFAPACAEPQSLTVEDFVLAGSLLAGSADKTGRITADLVQYLNRLLKIPVATEESAAPVDTLPALIRDESGAITPAPDGLPFPANERFVDFSLARYLRSDWFNHSYLALQSSDGVTWTPKSVDLLVWLNYANGPQAPFSNIAAFIAGSGDALRVVEFVHNYEVPADLWSVNAFTRTLVHNVTTQFQAAPQNLALTATITSQAAVNGGVVTFSVRTAGAVSVGAAATSGPVVNGTATATYVLPAGTPAQTLVITAAYGGTTAFAPSIGIGSLVIEPAPLPLPTVTSLTPSVPLPVPAGSPVTWTASVTGGVTPYSFRFSVFDGSTWTVGQDWSGSNAWTWYPAAPGSYAIQVSVRNAGSSSAYDAQLSTPALITSSGGLTVTSVTPSASSAPAGTPVTWTVAATGGTGPYSYAFWMFDGTRWTEEQGWSPSNAWTWTPAAAGTYRFQVWVRNAGSAATYDAYRDFGPYTTTRPLALTVTAFTPDPISPVPAGTPVQWTARALGGTEPYTYKFLVFDGSAWSVGQDWSDSATWTWIPPSEGTYYFQVWARNAGSVLDYDAWRSTAPFTVTESAPLTITSILADRTFPVPAGASVNWTTHATGGSGPYSYRLLVFNGTSWTLEQDWSPSSTLTWIPATPGTYNAQIWVRNAGSVADYDAWGSTEPVVISAPTALSVTSLTPSPGVPLVAGGPATFTATATGGTGPYTYRFFVYDGTSWSVTQEWGPSNTWTFTPTAAGTYAVQVWVRNAGSVADWDAWKAFGMFTVVP